MAVAETLSLIAPLKKVDFVRAAEAVAKDREIAAVHYESDSRAGAKMARDAVAELATVQLFKDLLAQATIEWKPDADLSAGTPGTD